MIVAYAVFEKLLIILKTNGYNVALCIPTTYFRAKYQSKVSLDEGAGRSQLYVKTLWHWSAKCSLSFMNSHSS